MGRPPRYDADSLLDTALALAAALGPGAVTMSAVIESVGAPSGSLYHRFPNRPALLAALWLRTMERFQAGFLEAAVDEDGEAAALAAAAHTIEWSRSHSEQARVLLYGVADFGHEEWSATARKRLASRQALVAEAVNAMATKLDLSGSDGRERTTLATVDLPLALVRRHLTAGEAVPAEAERLVEPAVRALLSLR